MARQEPNRHTLNRQTHRLKDIPYGPPEAKYGRDATKRLLLEAIAEQGGILPAPETAWHRDVLVVPKKTP